MTATLPARNVALNSRSFQASALPDAVISVWLFMVLSLLSLISLLGAVDWDLVQWLHSKKTAERRSLCTAELSLPTQFCHLNFSTKALYLTVLRYEFATKFFLWYPLFRRQQSKRTWSDR